MPIEDTLVATAVHAWKTEIDKAAKYFEGLTDAQLQAPIAPGKNRLVYLWGHLIAVHDRMIPLLGIGERLHPELDAPFLHDADAAHASAPSPSAADLQRWWDEVHPILWSAFTTWTAADWAARHTAVTEADFATNPLRNRLAVLLSRTSHVSYHIGQVVLVKK